MQNKDQLKTRILKTILTNFSRKEKAIPRYTKIYIKRLRRTWLQQRHTLIAAEINLLFSMVLT